MTRPTLISIVLVLVCIMGIGCGDDDPAAPPPPNEKAKVVVDPAPDSINCSWQLQGPNSYSHNGQGDETLTDLAPGDYAVTWEPVSGWTSPDPVTETKSAAAGGTVTFTCTYTQQAGSITVDAEPNSLNATWVLTGPNSYNHNGTGDETLADLEPGDYTLTWATISGWTSPDPAIQTQTMAAGGSLTYTGTYIQQAGSITVDAEPDDIDAPWELTGPNSYSYSGTGDETLTGLTTGSYTLTWTAVTGYDSPDPDSETLALPNGGTLTFNGTYTSQALTGTVHVRPQNVIDAPWHLDGPNSFSLDGQGLETLTDMAVGDYTATWGPVSGYSTPNPVTLTLAEGGSISLLGPYAPQVSELYVEVNPNSIAPPWHLEGPGGWTYDGNGSVHLANRPWGDYTITWGALSGWNLPDPDSETITVDATLWQTFVGNYTQTFVPEMVPIPAGTFQMGSPVTELGRYDNETQHWVQLSSFYMCTTELTHGQYQAIIPDHEYNCVDCAYNNLPRADMFVYCNLLSERDGYQPCYTINGSDVTWNQNADGYRLPTEAEWEYACRAGTTTAFSNGEITDIACADPVLDLVAWYCGNSQSPSYQVATKPANPWGLYDMHGNVWECVWDALGDYGTGTFENPDVNPTGPATGTQWVQRGGQKDQTARNCRSAGNRMALFSRGGFRLVRNGP